MPDIFDFYIVTETGICIYARAPKKKLDEDLLPAFLIAMDQYVQHITAEAISSFTFQTSKLVYFFAGGLYFIARADHQAREDDVRNKLAEIYHIVSEEVLPATCNVDWNICSTKIAHLAQKFDERLNPFFESLSLSNDPQSKN